MKARKVIFGWTGALCWVALLCAAEKALGADQVLRYSCSPQIYEAFGEERLTAFTQKTGIKVDLAIHASPVAIDRLMNGLADIVGTAQRLSAVQRDSGYLETACCRDPIAIIVNAECPVTGVSDLQLQDVFSGKTTNWRDLGGPDRPIVVIIPSEQTAAHRNFREQVMGGRPLFYDIMTTKSTMVIDTTRRIPWSISFTAQGAARLITHGLKKLKINGLAPEDQDYPYFQIFSFVTRGTPTGIAKKFIEFSLSPEGKDIVRRRGMVPDVGVKE
jgi:ABC-type phosphate transport system substrate-binding protein